MAEERRHGLRCRPVAAVLSTPAPTSAAPAWLDHLRDATQPYQSLKTAKADGYGKLKDAEGIACIDMPGEGGMDVDFVNGDLVGDAEVLGDPPEASSTSRRPTG